MSILFTPIKMGGVEIKNRFIQSATYECLSGTNGEVTDGLINRYRNLAKGEVGLTIPGHMYVHPLGRGHWHQTGIDRDELVPGLRKLVEAVHHEGGKIVFQLGHGGLQSHKSVTGHPALGPSAIRTDPLDFVRPKVMREEDIREAIQAFGQAAARAVEAGADGVQLHAAHGYLINEFLSPFFNRREDEWGGSDEKRFRFLKEVLVAVKKVLVDGRALLVKLNAHDYTPRPGITPSLAVQYARWLVESGIDGLEISCGTAAFSPMNSVRGGIPVEDFLRSFPWWKKPLGRFMVKKWIGKYNFEEAFNQEAAKMIRPVLNGLPLFLVGGLRTKAKMEEILENKYADGISMSRPFIKEPFIVKKFREGKAEAVACVSCNRCAACIIKNEMPLRCYQKETSADNQGIGLTGDGPRNC